MKDFVEIRWHGRGGQGAVTAAKILAESAILDGKFIQAKIDTDLALAFMVAILSTTDYSYEALVEKIRNGGKI